MDHLFQRLQKNKDIMLLLLFFPFMFVQLVSLRAGNSAGMGYLSAERQELVYCFLQVAVILGFVLHMFANLLLKNGKGYRNAVLSTICVCAADVFVLLFAPVDSAFYLAVTAISAVSLGFLGGAVYYRLSRWFTVGNRPGLCFGLGYAGAIALQYALQLRWTVKPLLAVLTLLSFAALFIIYLSEDKAVAAREKPPHEPVSARKIICVSTITLAMLVFINYYNTYIHHLQIASGYMDYNVYTWPRLLMIPGILLFGWIGDKREGRLLPISALCMVVIAQLNVLLVGKDTDLLNMCLYYLSLTAAVAYYHITFLRLAPRAKHPALWAGMGRMLDSAVVILALLLGFSEFSSAAVLVIDLVSLIVMIVLMAVGGDFNLSVAAPQAPAPAPASLPLSAMPERFGITPSEMRVLRELVLTDDKQEAIAQRLGISVSTVRHHITSIYKKTGAQTRAALCKLVGNHT